MGRVGCGSCCLADLACSAQEVKQKVFGSPEEAMKTLVEKVKAGDTKGMMAILGPEGEDIIDSGDEVADKNAREQFVKAYQERVDFVKEKEDRVSIIIGNDHWPLPIPIVKKGEGWVFDTKAGREEVLNRRIGRNELKAIQVCLAYVEAQRDYATTDRGRDGIIQYAQKIASDTADATGFTGRQLKERFPVLWARWLLRPLQKGTEGLATSQCLFMDITIRSSKGKGRMHREGHIIT